MAYPVEEITEGIRSFFKSLKDGQIRKMYRKAQGDRLQREFPQLAPGRPARDIRKLWTWALVNEHDSRRLA
jgi:hypothetical protein